MEAATGYLLPSRTPDAAPPDGDAPVGAWGQFLHRVLLLAAPPLRRTSATEVHDDGDSGLAVQPEPVATAE